MSQQIATLMAMVVIGLVSRNQLILMAGVATLALMTWQDGPILPWIAEHGIQTGLFFLLFSVFAELGTGRVLVTNLLHDLTSTDGLLALLGGVIAAWVCARGVELLAIKPQVTIGLVVGSIIATLFLRGVPIGPLFAAGVAAVLLRMLQWLSH